MIANFSEDKYWVTSLRRKILITDLETTHLLNIIKMLVQQTERTTNLLISSFEVNEKKNLKSQEKYTDQEIAKIIENFIFYITSCTDEEVIIYVLHTTLAKSMINELKKRKVNVGNYLEKIMSKQKEGKEGENIMENFADLNLSLEICSECGEKAFLFDGMCETCREDYIYCDDCGELVLKDETYQINNKILCQGCSDNYEECDECGKYVLTDDCIEHGGYSYCEECFNDIFSECTNCGDIERTDDLYRVINGGLVCSHCLENDYRYCEGCDEYFPENDGSYSSHTDEWLCNNCYEQSSCRFIHQYHDSHDDDVEFFGAEDDGENLFMGVELEIDSRDSGMRAKTEETAEFLLDEIPAGFITLEADGSLNHGFEIITQPATLNFHESISNNYKKAFEKAISDGWKSHNISTCGIHVHINRTFFGEREEECVAKLLYMTERFWDELVKFSRRDLSNLRRWANKYDMTAEEIIEKSKCRNLGRYYAVNLTNSETIEFRMFKGTLKFETFLATLQLVDTLSRFSKEKSIEELTKINFEDLLTTENLKDYWELVKDREVKN